MRSALFTLVLCLWLLSLIGHADQPAEQPRAGKAADGNAQIGVFMKLPFSEKEGVQAWLSVFPEASHFEDQLYWTLTNNETEAFKRLVTQDREASIAFLDRLTGMDLQSQEGARRRQFTLSLGDALIAYFQQSQQPDNAEHVFIRMIEWMDRAQVKDRDLAITLMNLGQHYKSLERFEESEAANLRALELFNLFSQPTDSDFIQLRINMAVLYGIWGKPARSLQQLDQVLELQTRRYGRFSEEVGHALNNLALVNYDLGNRPEAIRLHREALEVREKVLPEHHHDFLNTLTELGELLVIQRDPEGLELLERYLHILEARFGGNHSDLEPALSLLGQALLKFGSERAVPVFQRLLTMRKSVYRLDGPEVARTLGWLGLAHRRLNQPAEAEAMYRRSLEIYKSLPGYESRVALVLNNLSYLFYLENRFEEAIALLRQAIAFYGTAGEEHAWIMPRVWENLGDLLREIDDYAEAEHAYQQAIAIRRKLLADKHPQRFRDIPAFEHFGALTERGDLLKIDNPEHDLVLARLRENLGKMYASDLGRYEEAKQLFQAALDAKKELIGADHIEVASLSENLGVMLSLLGDYSEADRLLRHALGTKQLAYGDQHIRTVMSRLNIASNRHFMGDHEPALAEYGKVLEIVRANQDEFPEETAFALSNAGAQYAVAGKMKKAKALLQEALTIREKILGPRHPDFAHTLINLAGVYRAEKDFAEAIRLAKRATEILRQTVGETDPRFAVGQLFLGKNYAAMKEAGKARQALEEALVGLRQRPDQYWVADAYLGEMLADMGHAPQALEHFRRAIATIEQLRAGLHSQEDKIVFFRDKIDAYDGLIKLLIANQGAQTGANEAEEAFRTFEQRQARVFLEQVAASGARRFRTIPESLRDRQSQLTALIRAREKELITIQKQHVLDRDKSREAKIQDDIVSFNQELQELQMVLERDYPEYLNLMEGETVKLADFQKAVLKSDEAMLIYMVTEDETIIYFINQNDLQLFSIPLGESELQNSIQRFRASLRVRDVPLREPQRGRILVPDQTVNNPQQLAHELYQSLFPQELRNRLSTGQRLYIIPTAGLYSLPFEALITDIGETSVRYLLEDHTIVYIASASVLRSLREAERGRNRSAANSFLAFAAPQYRAAPREDKTDKAAAGRGVLSAARERVYRNALGGHFRPLPQTKAEAESIARLLKIPFEGNVLLGKAASRSHLFELNRNQSLRNFRYILFATHGLLPGDISGINQPALVLSHPEPNPNPESEDQTGFLTMADVLNLRLDANLVVLSACNTGRGDSQRGEGVMGLTRAFMYAGTSSVAVTLWAVEDESAKELSVEMFRNLIKGAGPAGALRKAKLEMLRGNLNKDGKSYTHPYHWAPLVLFGNGG